MCLKPCGPRRRLPIQTTIRRGNGAHPKLAVPNRDGNGRVCRSIIAAMSRQARFALRIFSRGGGAYLVAIGVLALGIGMTTAVFSLVQTVLLRPLPFDAQDSLRV